MYCLATGDFWDTRSITVLCRNIKPVRHRGLKIADECYMHFIFTLVTKTIRMISPILTIQSIYSKRLWIAAIERRYPLYFGLLFHKQLLCFLVCPAFFLIKELVHFIAYTTTPYMYISYLIILSHILKILRHWFFCIKISFSIPSTIFLRLIFC